ncbi:MAG: aldo/keto reductase [Desulfobacterales bacterium]|nr:aldo/keto reductase [Desulfobacterales bacterium]
MRYRRIGKSGLTVSEIGLGGNNFGQRADEKSSLATIRHALALGINFIDTADVYNQGRSEEIVGKAVQAGRSRVIIATKFGHPNSMDPAEQGGSRRYILKAVEASLKRLGTDYIDLYYIHRPDEGTPVEETLRALDDLVAGGKVRYFGCSNFAAWQLCEAVWTSKVHNVNPFIAVQSRYNLIDRDIETELVPCCQTYGVGVIPWAPLAAGFLTGKYRPDRKMPANARLAKSMKIYDDVLTEANFDKLAALESLAAESGRSILELAVAWLLSRPWVGSVIAGMMTPEQADANVAAAASRLTPDEVARIEKIS